MSQLDGMTQDRWNQYSAFERERLRDNSGLSPQLTGLEGWRSTGWKPCHLEVKTRRSFGGMAAESMYTWVRKLEKVR